MMMAALAIQGVQMGPLLLKAQPEYLAATFISMVLANIVMVFVSLFVAKSFSRFLTVPYWILAFSSWFSPSPAAMSAETA